MNPHLSRIVLRVRGPLEVFDLAWRLIRETWRTQARMLAVTWLPVALLGVPLCWFAEGSAWTLLWPLLWAPILQAPFTVLTGRLLFDPQVRVGAVLRELLGRAKDLAGSQLVAAFGTSFGVLTCFYGLIPVQAALLYLPEATLLERVGVSRATRRSMRLAGGHVGIALLGAVSRWALTLWFGLVGESSGQALFTWVLQLGAPFGSLMTGEVTPFLLGGLLLAQPVHAVYRLLLYVDVRTRNEGWDLQVGLRAAGLAR